MARGTEGVSLSLEMAIASLCLRSLLCFVLDVSDVCRWIVWLLGVVVCVIVDLGGDHEVVVNVWVK